MQLPSNVKVKKSGLTYCVLHTPSLTLYTLHEWADFTGIKLATLRKRLRSAQPDQYPLMVCRPTGYKTVIPSPEPLNEADTL
jgi:hypothetical protein